MATTAVEPAPLTLRRPPRVRTASAVATLAARRAALTARNPRQIAVPLLTPILFATVIAPALRTALGGLHSSLDYTAYVSVGTVGLLVPFTAVFAGLSVIVDRNSGAQRELLAAPIPRVLLVLANLVVVLGLAALQVGVLLAVAVARGATFDTSAAGVAWFLAAAVAFTVLMYAIAETLAGAIARQEEYVATTPALAVLPWFFAGALFPIGALPAALTDIAKALPLTHVMALMRYGLIDRSGGGLHDIWGGGMSTATDAWLSLAVVLAFAAALAALAVRTFTRAAVR
ncbi:MAG: type transport system permease protein [Solirubrobacteraceae bacterium]|jgi:ABC-2 type transport system permease protein|nr:type transport system permease protein [Solirubrobacteraceae bacterium]